MELLLAQIAARCRRAATRARLTLTCCRERGDQQGLTSAESDLLLSSAVARAAVVRLHRAHQRGEVDARIAARVGVDLVETLCVVEAAMAQVTGVMFRPSLLPPLRLELPETLQETEMPQVVRNFGEGASIRRSSDG